jgi:hypothetical protein
MAERWLDPAFEGFPPRPTPTSRSSPRPAQRSRRGADSLEQGLDRLMSAGRQLVDGVSGARPGSRTAARAAGSPTAPRPRLGELGRWVEDKLDWILEEEDDWREPWQEPRQEPDPPVTSPRAARPVAGRRPLEAISRRPPLAGSPGTAPAPAPGLESGDWPEDDSFSRPRWQRPAAQSDASQRYVPRSPLPDPAPAPSSFGSAVEPTPARPVPRSSRRRPLD